MLDYYRHRLSDGVKTRCLTDFENFAAGVKTTQKPLAASAPAAGKAPKPEYVKRKNNAVLHAEWLLKRGMSAQQIEDKGLSAQAIAKAIDEIKKDQK